jgi:hypothetical protein
MPHSSIQICRSDYWDSVIFLIEVKSHKVNAAIYFDDPHLDISQGSLNGFARRIWHKIPAEAHGLPVIPYCIENHRGAGSTQRLKFRRLKLLSPEGYTRHVTLPPSIGVWITALEIQAEGAFPVSKRLREAGQ